MLSCPNENSEEWKRILAEANGNRERAIELWQQEGYNEIEDLNTKIDDTTFKEERQGEPDSINEPKDKFSTLIEDIKLYLYRKRAILGQKKLKDQRKKEEEYTKLIQNFEAAEGVESINIFIKDAYEKGQVASRVFATLLENKDTYSRDKVLEELTALADFANGYSILDEISDEDVYEFFSKKVDPKIPDGELTPQEILTKAIAIRNEIRIKYVREGLPLMADFLLGYKKDTSEKDLAEIKGYQAAIDRIQAGNTSDEHKKQRIKYYEDLISIRQGFSIDKKQMIELLKKVNKDESLLAFLVDPLISSPDAAIALFAKAIKSHLEIKRQDDIDLQEELLPKMEAYAKTVSAGRDNPAKFNEGIYEELVSYFKDPKTGAIKENRKMAFVQKYDINKFKKAQTDFFKALGPAPVITEDSPDSEKNKLKHWRTRVATWMRENKQPLPEKERNEIIAAKEKEFQNKIITEDELNEWKEQVMPVDEYGNQHYKGELSQPSEKYINVKWTAMYDKAGNPKNEKGKYHKYLTDIYFKAQERLPKSQRRGYTLPSILKTDLERAQTKGVLKTLGLKGKELVKIQAQDRASGLVGASEEEAEFLPVHYTQFMKSDDVSLDLARSVMLFNSMSNKYEAMSDLNGEIALFKNIIDVRKVTKTNSKGQPIIDAFAKKTGLSRFIKDNDVANSKKHVDAFIEMVVYEEMQKAEEVIGVSLAKVTNTLTGFSALTSIAVDALKGVANNLQGNIQLIIEANSGEFFNHKNRRVGKRVFWKNIPKTLADFGKSGTESLIGQLIERYDAIQGTFKDNYGNNVTGSAVARLLRTDTLFFNQSFGEYELQGSTMLALMDATKVIDNNTGKEITLLEAHQKYGAKPKDIAANTNFTEEKRQAFQNRLHALNKRMHGVYNDFDKGTMQRYSMGRLAIMYRKHLVPGYNRRWKKISMDQELDSTTEGYYITFWNIFLKDLVKFKFNAIQGWSTYTPFQKAQVGRVIAEATIILTTTALVAILKSMVDDDDDELKKNYAYNFVLYEMVRMRSETAAYISPTDAYRVVKSPSAMTSTVERAIKFGDQFFLTWDPEKLDYQRKQGVWNKGDNKSWAYFLKLMGYSGYNLTPAAAVESFEGTLKK